VESVQLFIQPCSPLLMDTEHGLFTWEWTGGKVKSKWNNGNL